MSEDLRKAFFGQIRARREALEKVRKTAIFEEIVPVERLYAYLDYVGSFLIETGVITLKDRDIALGMIEDYEERLKTLFPELP